MRAKCGAVVEGTRRQLVCGNVTPKSSGLADAVANEKEKKMAVVDLRAETARRGLKVGSLARALWARARSNYTRVTNACTMTRRTYAGPRACEEVPHIYVTMSLALRAATGDCGKNKDGKKQKRCSL